MNELINKIEAKLNEFETPSQKLDCLEVVELMAEGLAVGSYANELDQYINKRWNEINAMF